MKEKNLDQDFPPDLPTNHLYDVEYLNWQKDFSKSVVALASRKLTEKVKEE